jgi:hypothetical protein
MFLSSISCCCDRRPASAMPTACSLYFGSNATARLAPNQTIGPQDDRGSINALKTAIAPSGRCHRRRPGSACLWSESPPLLPLSTDASWPVFHVSRGSRRGCGSCPRPEPRVLAAPVRWRSGSRGPRSAGCGKRFTVSVWQRGLSGAPRARADLWAPPALERGLFGND